MNSEQPQHETNPNHLTLEEITRFMVRQQVLLGDIPFDLRHKYLSSVVEQEVELRFSDE